MTASAAPTPHTAVASKSEIRRSQILGTLYLVLGLFVFFVFAIGSDGGTSTFGLVRRTDRKVDVPACCPARAASACPRQQPARTPQKRRRAAKRIDGEAA